MDNYIYNLGIETSKLMNAVYSITSINRYASNFFFGINPIMTTKPVYPVSRALPTSVIGITGPLALQNILIKLSSNNSYYSTTGSYSGSKSLFPLYDIQYSKFSCQFSGSVARLYEDKFYQSVSKLSLNFEPSFAFNTSLYNDDNNVILFSKVDNNEYDMKFMGFFADSYNANYAQTFFGNIAGNYLKNSTTAFSSVSGVLESAFSDLVEACADFSSTSYSLSDMKSEFADYSNTTVAAFKKFADINLDV